uniref:PA domain-containing protein n=1 Tax=Junco hyemalis TaxID=40217 RepID=A0A8C5JAP8_JUNHY
GCREGRARRAEPTALQQQECHCLGARGDRDPLFYFNSTSNRTLFERCECGLYGFNSPYIGAQGVVGIPVPDADPYACDRNTAFTVMEAPWIALIERGNCSFAEKIQVATRRGAAAAVIYNSRGRGNSTLLMAHQGEWGENARAKHP